MTSFEPKNPLESALKKAADDPAVRPQFLRLLLESKVLIEAVGPRPKTANGMTTEAAQIQVKGIHFNSPLHPLLHLRRTPAGGHPLPAAGLQRTLSNDERSKLRDEPRRGVRQGALR